MTVSLAGRDISICRSDESWTGSSACLWGSPQDSLHSNLLTWGVCACLHSSEPDRVLSCRSGRAFSSESEDAAQAAVDFTHEGRRQVAGGLIEVCLVEGDQGRDVDD